MADTYYQTVVTRNPGLHTKSSLVVKENPNWSKVVTFDCNGIDGNMSTISGTSCNMNIPEICQEPIPATKIAIEQAWSIQGVSQRLNINEWQMRENLFHRVGNPMLLDKSYDTYLPQIGGTTIYIFGDYNNRTSETKIAARVHDECSGSDTFGKDICTCRPYLLYAIRELDKFAKNGNLGILIYNRKEGRALGEVTKFMVYNARKHQECGDCAEKYFENTINVASIKDARLQKLMPDPFLWLGITKIDVWYSMSNEKSDALACLDIEIVEQVEIPEHCVPQAAQIEIDAKKKDGYFGN